MGFLKLALLSLLAAATMAAAASSAQAATARVTGGTGTAISNNLTLTSSIINTVGNVTLTYNVPNGTYTANTGTTLALTQVGTVTGAAGNILSPPNCVGPIRFSNLPWRINVRSANGAFLLSGTQPITSILGILFTITCSGVPATFSGDVTANLTNSTTMTITANNLTGPGGSRGGFTIPSIFRLSTPITFALS